jgi:NAD(P)-dependent dehydrogenase (short-subunit alcohol dehydrogenase family)
VQGDVSNLADLDRLYAKVAREKGKIDILFAGAGIIGPIPPRRLLQSIAAPVRRSDTVSGAKLAR